MLTQQRSSPRERKKKRGGKTYITPAAVFSSGEEGKTRRKNIHHLSSGLLLGRGGGKKEGKTYITSAAVFSSRESSLA